MSGLERLPPDQRAVLQLILAQGRGYADLAAMLRLDPAAVRERAHAGAAALAGAELDAATRGRVVDYLLGQQDDGERIVTYAELGGSPGACRWAQALREQFAGLARDTLPEVPAATAVVATANGSGSVATVPEPAVPEPAPSEPAPSQPAVAAIPPAEPPHDLGAAGQGAPSGPRPSRLGGAILIAGAVALAVVLAIVLTGGDDDNGSPAATSAAQTQQTQSRAQTQPSTSGASTRAQARTIGAAVLRPASGAALGAALIQQFANGQRLLAVEAARLPGNTGQEFYGIWLQGSAGNRFLGFVPRQVRADGTFTVSSQMPRGLDLSTFATVLVTTEGSNAVPTTPGTTVLSGPLRLAG